jgi:hypothetical protein
MKRLLSQFTTYYAGLQGPRFNYSYLSFLLPGISSIDPIHIENIESTRKLFSAGHFDKNSIGFLI